jgi:hypothetical protein
MKKVAKAITAAIVAGAGAVATAYGDGTINTNEWISIAAAFVVAGVGVYYVPNKKVADTGEL